MKERIITISIFVAVIATSVYFGFHRLESYSGVDEPLWSYDRVPQFWDAIQSMKWKYTALCDKPGVTLAAISGIGLHWVSGDPAKLGDLRYAPKSPQDLQALRSLYFDLRLPVYLFTLAMLPIFYWLIKKLLGKNIARSSIIFIGLSPVLLGISLMINADAVLWSLIPLALLSFLVYQKENNRNFLYLSGFLLGLALIDKYIANILFLFFFGLIFLKYIFEGETRGAEKYFKKAFADFGLLILVSAVTIFVFFPAVWVKPKILLDVTIYSKAFYRTWRIFFALLLLAAADTYLLKSKIISMICDPIRTRKNWLRGAVYAIALALMAFVFVNTYSGMKFFDFQPVFNFPTLELKQINARFGEPLIIMLSSFYPFLFSLIPAAAILFVLAVVRSGVRRMGKDESLPVFCLLLFILFYYLGSAASGVSPTPRYQIVLYPVASIIAAIGLGHLLDMKSLKKYFSSVRSHLAVLLILFAVSIWSLVSIRPFYLSYTSDLLPKQDILDLRNMGDGSWESAQYLNGLPDAKNIKVWADEGGVCEAFVGACSDTLKPDQLNTSFDYFVVSAGREAKSVHMAQTRLTKLNGAIEVGSLYSETNPYQFQLNVGGRSGNFVKVMKADSLP
ncbi:MAG: glycosyltransferase family 39 protein [Candidatus Moranbacteria bacterium]|nr:glycosyltransferase family 39 protein [Candidatus Moranbacteria bacterium]